MIELDFYKVTQSNAGQNASVVTLQLKGFGTSANDSAAETVNDAEHLQPIGFASRPQLTGTTEAICIRRGDEVIALVVLDKGQQNSGAGPALGDLQQGETRVYGAAAPSAWLKIAADGTINVFSANGKPINITARAGGNVVVNGGTNAVGRVGDQVQVTLTAVEIGTINDSTGHPCLGGPITLTGTITAGAPNFTG